MEVGAGEICLAGGKFFAGSDVGEGNLFLGFIRCSECSIRRRSRSFDFAQDDGVEGGASGMPQAGWCRLMRKATADSSTSLGMTGLGQRRFLGFTRNDVGGCAFPPMPRWSCVMDGAPRSCRLMRRATADSSASLGMTWLVVGVVVGLWFGF